MKKHINITIIILLILNSLLIYFAFFGAREKTTVQEMETSKDVIKSISVEYEAYGNPLSNVKVTNIEDTNASINNVATKVDSPFDISGNFSNLQLKNATVTIKYDEKKLAEDVDENNLLVLWYDEKNNKMVEMPTKVNADKNTVTFKTDHFSQYVLVDKATWEAIWDVEVAKIRDKNVEFSIEFIIDDSGSMTSNDPTKRRISAAKAAISSLSKNDEYLVMKFSDSSEVIQDFTSNSEDNSEIFEEFKSSGGTNISGAVEKGIEILKKEDDDREKIIILLTDGEDSSLKSKVDDLVEKANKENIKIYGIGLQSKNDSNLNFDVFKDLAERADGKFYRITETQLSDIFLQLTNATVGVDGTKDFDKDGIPDGIEINGMRDQYGNIIHTNAYLADSDDDKKSDKDEMGQYNEKKGYYQRVSHPLINEDNPNYYTESNLGPTKTGEGVHDSGFRPDINGFSFYNFSLDGDGGNCAGIAYFAERVYNGTLGLSDGTYGKYLPEDVFETLVKSKRLYDYKISLDKLKLRTDANIKKDPYIKRQDILDSHEEAEDAEGTEIYDGELLYELDDLCDEANKLSRRVYGNLLAGARVSDKLIKEMSDIFDRKEIVSLQLYKWSVNGTDTHNHIINAYALEKMSDTEYRLYVYDSNFPYNPNFSEDSYAGNTYITLIKSGIGKYSFYYSPSPIKTHWQSDEFGYFNKISVYYGGEHLDN